MLHTCIVIDQIDTTVKSILLAFLWYIYDSSPSKFWWTRLKNHTAGADENQWSDFLLSVEDLLVLLPERSCSNRVLPNSRRRWWKRMSLWSRQTFSRRRWERMLSSQWRYRSPPQTSVPIGRWVLTYGVHLSVSLSPKGTNYKILTISVWQRPTALWRFDTTGP